MDTKKDTLHVIYGSRSGNSKAVAVLAHDYAQWIGLKSALISMDDFNFEHFKSFSHVMIIVSTHGEGEPPVPAEDFHAFIHNHPLELLHMHYAVLGLGDSSYRYFCQTGQDFNDRLTLLGATRIKKLEKCDIDFEEQSKTWVKSTVEKFAKNLPKHPQNKDKPFAFELKLDDSQQANAYKAHVLSKTTLNGALASHPTMNITLSLKDSGFDFHPGDVVGIYASNARLLVDKLLRKLHFDPAYPIIEGDKQKTLKEALLHEYELTVITPVLVKNYAQLAKNNNLDQLTQNKTKLNEYIQQRDVLDLVSDYPGNYSVNEFLKILRKLSPRLYSASSYQRNGQDQVDLTIRNIDYVFENRQHQGVCSDFVWTRVEKGEKLPIFVESNARFQLPKEQNQDVIMICTGTGIAPFRSFLQYRTIQEAKGRNWLFFGERNSKTDFFYKDEMLGHKQSGILNALDTTFSRDTSKKHYIHQRLIEKGEDVYNWLETGAKIYLCGNKNTMANDVRTALTQILSIHGNMSEETAQQRLKQMRSEKVLQEDIY